MEGDRCRWVLEVTGMERVKVKEGSVGWGKMQTPQNPFWSGLDTMIEGACFDEVSAARCPS